MKRSISLSSLALAKPSLLPTVASADNLRGKYSNVYHRLPKRQVDYSFDAGHWIRVIVVVCVLGGCLVFTGEPPPVRQVKPRTFTITDDACAQALKFPKIALLFLLKGPMYHGKMWQEWLSGASRMVPAEYISEFACINDRVTHRRLLMSQNSSTSIEKLLGACGRDAPHWEHSSVGAQHIFNMYIHVSKEIDLDVLDASWKPHTENISRIVTKWGHHSLVEATRELLLKAFEDPANERFMLLSESHVPLWDPLTIYRIAMNEKRSFINAWWHDDMNINRWTKKMKPHVQKHNWRKSQQWFSLIRKHVALILEDEDIFKVFNDYCIYEWDFDNMKHRKCFSDEHYFATLLSTKGLEEETVPFFATNTMVDWSEGGPHPKSFGPKDISAEYIKNQLRSYHDCPISPEYQKSVQKNAKFSFIHIDSLDTFGTLEAMCDAGKSHGKSIPAVDLPAGCTSFARKFQQDTVEPIMTVFRDPDLGILL